MDPNAGLIFWAIIGLFLVLLGGIYLVRVPQRFRQVETTDAILKKLAFKEAGQVRAEIIDYFAGIIGRLTRANLCFYIAFMILAWVVEGLNPQITGFQAMIKVLMFAWIPFVLSMVTKCQLMNLRTDCLVKIKKS